MWIHLALLGLFLPTTTFAKERVTIGAVSQRLPPMRGLQKGLLDCYLDCLHERYCYGIDWKQSKYGPGDCFPRGYNDECINFALRRDPYWTHIKKSCEYKPGVLGMLFNHKHSAPKVSGRITCTTSTTYTIADGSQIPGGIVATDVANSTIQACFARCTRDAKCYSIDFNKDTNTCWVHQFSGVAIRNHTCCTHAEKECPGLGLGGGAAGTGATNAAGVSTVTPATGTMAPTVPPMLASANNTIPDNGCPDPLTRIDNANQLGGEMVAGITTAEACKRFCVNNGTCMAADFNSDEGSCWYHAQSTPALLITGITCCTHWVKVTDCFTGSCYGDIRAVDTDLTAADNAMMMVCPNNLCRVEKITTVTAGVATFKVTRMCEAQKRKAGCSTFINPSPVAPIDMDATVSCACAGAKCNALSADNILTRLAYFPLDRHAFDLSGFMRNGMAFNISYDPFTQIRNSSAFFNGMDAFIQFDLFANIAIGEVQADGTIRAGTTICFWMMETATGTHTILSNGATLNSPLLITSIPMNATHQILTWSVLIQGVQFTTSKEIPINQWLFVCTTVGTLGAGTPAMSIACGTQTTAIAQVATLNLPVAADAPLDLSSRPLCLGKQLTVNANSLLGRENFYVGHLDEVQIYNKVMSVTQMMALQDSNTVPLP